MRCSMPRRARIAPGEIIYRALNRANGRSQLFDKPEDYAAFERIMVAAMRRTRLGNLEDTDRGCARTEIHTSAPRQT
jgi:hypothetical protein